MARLSISDVWDDTRAFVAREHALLLPVALASFGAASLILALAVPAPPPGQAMAEPGAWALWLIPALLLVLVGNLAICVLALRGGVSVGEALAIAIRRLPAAAGAMLLLGLLVGAAALATLLFCTLLLGAMGQSWDAIAALSTLPMLAPALWLTARMMPAVPMLVAEPVGAVAALRRAFAMTRGHGLKLVAVTLIYGAFYLLVTSLVQVVGGSLLLLLGRALGAPAAGALAAAVLVAAAGTVLAGGWSAFGAYVYRRLGSTIGI